MPTETRDWTMRDTHLTLTADPASDVAAGEIVSLRCRLHGNGRETVGGALLRFVLPSEAVVTADDAAATLLPSLEPHAQLTIAQNFTVHPESRDGVRLRFEAVLTLPDGRLERSNVVVIRVRRRARLNGPRTTVHVQSTDDPREFIVACNIANDGTIAARMVTLDLPPPAGTRAIEPLGLTTWTLDQLGPGEARTFAYRARVMLPALRSVVVTDASVRDNGGAWVALPSSAPLALTAVLATPTIDVKRSGRRLHVTVAGSNTGGGSAREVRFTLHWPAAFVYSAPSLTWNATRVAVPERPQAFARARLRDDGADLTVASVEPGESYEFALDLDATSAAQMGTLSVDVRADGCSTQAQVTLPWSANTNIRLRVLDEPAQAVPVGSVARIALEAFNAGDNDTTVSLALNGVQAQIFVDGVELATGEGFELASGDRRQATIDIRVPDDSRDGETLSFPVVARVHGDDVACAAIAVRARNRVSIDTSAWLAVEDDVAIVQLRNTGITVARNAVVCIDGERMELGDIAPGATNRQPTTLVGRERTVRQATLNVEGHPTILLELLEASSNVLGAFDAIVRVAAGPHDRMTVPIALHIVCATSTRRLRICARALDAFPAIAGSLTIDGRPTGEGAGVPELYEPGGLVLRDICAGEHIDLRWNVQATRTDATENRVWLDIDADGCLKRIFSQELTREPQTTIDHRVDDLLLSASEQVNRDVVIPNANDAVEKQRLPATTAMQAGALSRSVTLFIPFDRTRIDWIISLLSGNAAPAGVWYAGCLQALLPTHARASDDALAIAVTAAHEALAGFADRLALKLRLPNFVPTSRDRADVTVRHALRDLLAAIGNVTAASADGSDAAAAFEVTVDGQWARQRSAQLEDEALGDALVVTSLFALLPVRANDCAGLGPWLEAYTQLLRAAVAQAPVRWDESAPLQAARRQFVEALIEARAGMPL